MAASGYPAATSEAAAADEEVRSNAHNLVVHFEGHDDEPMELQEWVVERFDYFRNLHDGGFSEAERGEARLSCKRSTFETFLMLARSRCQPAAVDLAMRMEVLRFADMVSAGGVVQKLSDSIREDYLSDGDGARDSAIAVLCELADLLTPATVPPPTPLDTTRATTLDQTRSSATSGTRLGHETSHGGAQLAPQPPSPAAVWLVNATGAAPMPTPHASHSMLASAHAGASGVGASASGAAASGAHGAASGDQNMSNRENANSADALVELREACLEVMPPWTRQRLTEKPQLWRLHLPDVLDVYATEASPRAESSWLALHAARRLSPDILPFACVDNKETEALAEEYPHIVSKRCVSLCVRELPFRKSVIGFGGTEYEIQVQLAPGAEGQGSWVLGVGGQGLCALRKVRLEVENATAALLGKTLGAETHELEFTGLMENAVGRQEDALYGFASGMITTPLPFSAKLTMLEYPLHLAVQTYIGLNFNTIAVLCQGFDFGPMDLACVMDMWLQSDHLRMVREADIADAVRRTLRFVHPNWVPVVRVSFVVCMHSCWMQAKHVSWHSSLINSCMKLEVWTAPSDGEPGAGTFRYYLAQVVQHAVAPHPEVFIIALEMFVEALPRVTFAAIEAFFQEPTSISDPVAIICRHYLSLLRAETAASVEHPSNVTVSVLMQLLDGFKSLVGPTMEHSEPKTAVMAFMTLAALCDLRHQRRLMAESVRALLKLQSRPADAMEIRFWAGCFFTLLEFASKLQESNDEVVKVGAGNAGSARSLPCSTTR